LRELLGSLPPPPPEVRLGPRLGEDACAIDVPGGTLVVATDPITLTGAGVGRHAVVVNANDVAGVGGGRGRVPPRGGRAPGRPGGAAEAGVAIVGGHTEVTAAVRQAVVVGQMLGLAADGRVVSTGGARPGDAIVQAGPAPVEAAAVLAAQARERLASLDVAT